MNIKKKKRMNTNFLRALIRQHTKLSRNHLTPEVVLQLITPDCQLWHAGQDNCPFDDPFWAFYWPGGQALTRYILDNPDTFHKKSVLDIGSGCGSAAVAARMVGATKVVANDIDPVAAVAIHMNMSENNVSFDIDTEKRLSTSLTQSYDFILMGDMFYDPDFTGMISNWMKSLKSKTTTVLIGDPGRQSFVNHPLKKQFFCAGAYDLPKTCQLENNGLTTANVWSFQITR